MAENNITTHHETNMNDSITWDNLCTAVKYIAWGYIFLHLDINIGTLNILPDWLGYLLFLWAIPHISEEEASAQLLRPLGILLCVWSALLWLITLFGRSLDIDIPETVATVINLYFHFQLLTNLADIAARYECPEHNRILNLRTIQTILITILALPLPWQKYTAITIGILVISIIVMLWINYLLFSLRRSLVAASEELG